MRASQNRILAAGILGAVYFLGFPAAASAQGPAYAIVTSAEIRALSTKLDVFADHKVARGFEVHIFDETDWLGSGLTGDVAAEALRTFLQSAETLYDFDYVLIIGDPRPETGPVPMKTLHPRTFGYQSTTPVGWNADCDSFVMTQDPVPTDYYYSDIHGNWDLDGDGLYGEFGDYDAPIGPTGDFGPGGGFQAGVIIAAGFVLYGLIFGLDNAERVAPPRIVEIGAALGVLLFAGTGLVNVLQGGMFLEYPTLGAHAGEPMTSEHITHGLHRGLLLIEAGVGITVACSILMIFYQFAGRSRA
ncbi:MAG: hypothetical protein HRU37_14565 [Roseibacillus sp.]|nr:hypothetical protein [Roseibacillus sp.]